MEVRTVESQPAVSKAIKMFIHFDSLTVTYRYHKEITYKKYVCINGLHIKIVISLSEEKLANVQHQQTMNLF